MDWLDKLLSDIRFWGAYSLLLVGLLIWMAIANPPITFGDYFALIVLFCIYTSLCPIIVLVRRRMKRQNDEMEAFRQKELAWCREQRAKYQVEAVKGERGFVPLDDRGEKR